MAIKFQQPALESVTDDLLFKHWRTSMFQVSFPSPSKCDEFHNGKLRMAIENNSILLPAILASASAHMAAAGFIPITEMLRRKGKAIKDLIRYLDQKHVSGCSKSRHSEAVLVKTASADALDMAVCASLHLIGTEITHGSDMATFLALVHGAISLVERWWTFQSLSNRNICPIVQLDLKLLAWHDLITCVPYPRRPLLDKRYWYDELQVESKLRGGDQDTVFGFTAQIALLTGECGALVGDFYSAQIDARYFKEANNGLLERLSRAVRDLPNLILMNEPVDRAIATHASNELLDYNACIWAAVAHALASQIYIHRAAGHSASISTISKLVSDLESAIRMVPCSSPAITIMLWPLWVWGCETAGDQVKQQVVVEIIEKMFLRNKFMNIRQCLETLRSKIWQRSTETNEERNEGGSIGHSECQRLESSNWVMHCYRDRIQVILV